MNDNHYPTDDATERIAALLKDKYCVVHSQAIVDVYRSYPAATRIRIVDPDFSGKTTSERWDEIWNILEDLPDEIYADITVCLLITPEEQPESDMNWEFENPHPTPL